MKFTTFILSGVYCWAERDIHGTFVSTNVSCSEVSEIHFGSNEVLVKKFPACHTGTELFRGHWYKANHATILEGGLDRNDQQVPLIYISKDRIKYHYTDFIRANTATSLDTLAMLGYGYYAARSATSAFKRILFHESEVTLFFSDSVKHGPWSVTNFSSNSVQGTIYQDEVTELITINKVSNTSLEINSTIFDKESQ
ncbi:hypothetical protein DSO57_1037776 [Entomophthora muscae]|uniref:Uncharacterized protein n=1 Tax=Entomophthora muscae TaxID=34485 RepID=A0ACC2SZ39_9FUNG|nr:hypothetical protein DSO57_1037776 [Entomophthora muscae]